MEQYVLISNRDAAMISKMLKETKYILLLQWTDFLFFSLYLIFFRKLFLYRHFQYICYIMILRSTASMKLLFRVSFDCVHNFFY